MVQITRVGLRIASTSFSAFGNFGDELFIQTHQQQLGDFCKPDVISDLPRAPYFSKPVRQMVQPFDAVIIGGGNFCPGNTLTRKEMAVFLAKALGLNYTD